MKRKEDFNKVDQFILIVGASLAFIAIIIMLFIGTRKGIWSNSSFYYLSKESSTGNEYFNKNRQYISIDKHKDVDKLITVTQKDTTNEVFYANIDKSGSYRAISIYAANKTEIWNGIYIQDERRLLSSTSYDEYVPDSTIGSATGTFSLYLDGTAGCEMILGEQYMKFSSNYFLLLYSILFLLLGLSIIYFKSFLIKFDIWTHGFFYDHTDTLKANDFTEDLMSLGGVLLFCFGMVFMYFFIFS